MGPYVRHIIALILLPVGLSLVVASAGLLLRRRWMVVAALVFLWACSTPLVGGWIIRAGEGWATRGLAADAPAADAVVVLSGGRSGAPGPAAVSEWRDADRFFGGVELFQAGKAPRLVFTGGYGGGSRQLEGDVLRRHAVAFGIPDDHILSTAAVTDTADEARAVAALAQAGHIAGRRVLLVTSAFHMARARAFFERAGFVVLPFPVDFLQPARGRFDPRDMLPSAAALARTDQIFSETYARVFYRLWPPAFDQGPK